MNYYPTVSVTHVYGIDFSVQSEAYKLVLEWFNQGNGVLVDCQAFVDIDELINYLCEINVITYKPNNGYNFNCEFIGVELDNFDIGKPIIVNDLSNVSYRHVSQVNSLMSQLPDEIHDIIYNNGIMPSQFLIWSSC